MYIGANSGKACAGGGGGGMAEIFGHAREFGVVAIIVFQTFWDGYKQWPSREIKRHLLSKR